MTEKNHTQKQACNRKLLSPEVGLRYGNRYGTERGNRNGKPDGARYWNRETP